MSTEQYPLKKVCIICAKGAIEDVYAALVMANGAVMEGIEAGMVSAAGDGGGGSSAATSDGVRRRKAAGLGRGSRTWLRSEGPSR